MLRHVYFNLHRRGWSIKNPTTGLVENKGTLSLFLVLQNVTFKVNESGRLRVIREQRKNVHSFAVGTIIAESPVGIGATEPPFEVIGATVPISYNPYKAGHFVRKDTGEAIYQVELLVMTTREQDGKRVPVVLAKV